MPFGVVGGIQGDDLVYGLAGASTGTIKVSGACASVASNVFKVKFSEALSSICSLRAYDSASSFPNPDHSFGSSYDIFSGTSGNGNKSMLCVIDTTRGGPSSSLWYSFATTTVGGFATVRLKGDTTYLTWRYSLSSLVAGASLKWNSLIDTPSDVTNDMMMLHTLAVQYSFVGTQPSVTFYANDETNGGTDTIPIWVSINPVQKGIRFGNESASMTEILGEIPLSGSLPTKTAWIVSS